MTRTVCIHQPDFAPHLGFFQRLEDSNVYIVLDDVQFIRRGWQHRDKIKTPRGAAWLTLSVRKTDFEAPISEVRLVDEDGGDWRRGNLNLIRENYRKAPFFDRIFPEFEALYGRGLVRMVDHNMAVLEWMRGLLDVTAETLFASDLAQPGAKSEKLARLTEAAGGDHYLTGSGSADYLDPAPFAARGIWPEIRPYEHPVYAQRHGDFVPYLSALDALMNMGPAARDLIRRRRETA